MITASFNGIAPNSGTVHVEAPVSLLQASEYQDLPDEKRRTDRTRCHQKHCHRKFGNQLF